MNSVALRVTPRRPGHALACINVSHELSMCIMQEPSDEIQTKWRIFTSLTAFDKTQLCAVISHDWYVCVCASLVHNCWILINTMETFPSTTPKCVNSLEVHREQKDVN